METQDKRLSQASLDTWPVPHFVADQVLSDNELAEVETYWPETAVIPEESPESGYLVGSFLSDRFWPFLTPIQQEFWRDFMHSVMPEIIAGNLELLAPWIEKKFGSRIEFAEFHTFALTEFTSDKAGVGCHVHSHDPNWLYTSLIHIDDGEESTDFRGNALLGFAEHESPDDYDEELCKRLASVRPFDPFDGLSIVRNYDFKPGRMFSFFETPISYHGTLPSQPGTAKVAKRRMIRMHLIAPSTVIQDVYGIEHANYQKLKYLEGEFDERMVSWIKRDIDDMYIATQSATGATAEHSDNSIPVRLPAMD